jgi:hypothetical protein
MSVFMDRIEKKQPEGGAPIFKFERPGDAIVSEFKGRRTVKTKSVKADEPARALDVVILESKVSGQPGPEGPHTVFESGDITRAMDNANLKPGDVFSLRYHSQDKATRYKRFAFEKLSDEEAKQLRGDDEPPDFGDEPPPDFDDR